MVPAEGIVGAGDVGRTEVMMQFGAEELNQMKRVENAIATAIMPFKNSRTETGLIVFALIRVARVLLWLYPDKVQAQLVPVLVAFIEGKGEPVDGGSLIVPPWKM